MPDWCLHCWTGKPWLQKTSQRTDAFSSDWQAVPCNNSRYICVGWWPDRLNCSHKQDLTLKVDTRCLFHKRKTPTIQSHPTPQLPGNVPCCADNYCFKLNTGRFEQHINRARVKSPYNKTFSCKVGKTFAYSVGSHQGFSTFKKVCSIDVRPVEQQIVIQVKEKAVSTYKLLQHHEKKKSVKTTNKQLQ